MADLPVPPPDYDASLNIYPSASATFYAPSDISGIGGMRQEIIRAVAQWRKGVSRYDVVFIKLQNGKPGMQGFSVGRLCLLFSFHYFEAFCSCALVDAFNLVGEQPDENTRMWRVQRATDPHTDILFPMSFLWMIFFVQHISFLSSQMKPGFKLMFFQTPLLTSTISFMLTNILIIMLLRLFSRQLLL